MSLILSDLEPATALQLRGKLHPPAGRLCSRSPEGCSPPGASLVLGSVAVCADFFIAWRRKCDCFIVSGRTDVVLGEHGIRPWGPGSGRHGETPRLDPHPGLRFFCLLRGPPYQAFFFFVPWGTGCTTLVFHASRLTRTSRSPDEGCGSGAEGQLTLS